MHVRQQHLHYIYNMISHMAVIHNAIHNSYLWLSMMKCSLNGNNGTDVFDYAFEELMRKTYPYNPDKRSADLTLTATYERIRKIDRQLVSQ